MSLPRLCADSRHARLSAVSCATQDSTDSSSLATPPDTSPSTRPSEFPIVAVIVDETTPVALRLSPITATAQRPRAYVPEIDTGYAIITRPHSPTASRQHRRQMQLPAARALETQKSWLQRSRSFFPQTLSRLRKAINNATLRRRSGSMADERSNTSSQLSICPQSMAHMSIRPKETGTKRHGFNRGRVQPGL